MRFLILSQYYPPEVGAPQVRLPAFARALMNRGHDVEVVTALPNYPQGRIFDGYGGRPARTEEIDGVRVRRVWLHAATGSGIGRMLNYLTFSATSLPGMASMRRPDILFVESPPPTLAITGWMVAKRWGAPMVLNISDLWPDSALQLGLLQEGPAAHAMSRLEAWAYRHSDLITAVTEGIRTVLTSKKQVPADKVLFLPNGVDTHLFAPMAPDARIRSELDLPEQPIVLLAGTLGYGQGVDVVLRAAAQLRDRAITFLIAGGGSDVRRLMALRDALALDNVRFLGARPVGDVASLYSLATVALVTLRRASVTDGARPSRTLAAMACAKPVVYSGAGEGARMLIDANAGVVVPPEDPQALALAITSLLAEPARAEEMGRNGRRFVEREFSWDALVGDWLHELTDRMARASAGGA